jgi:hypothetical protein
MQTPFRPPTSTETCIKAHVPGLARHINAFHTHLGILGVGVRGLGVLRLGRRVGIPWRQLARGAGLLVVLRLRCHSVRWVPIVTGWRHRGSLNRDWPYEGSRGWRGPRGVRHWGRARIPRGRRAPPIRARDRIRTWAGHRPCHHEHVIWGLISCATPKGGEMRRVGPGSPLGRGRGQVLSNTQV